METDRKYTTSKNDGNLYFIDVLNMNAKQMGSNFS